MNAYDAVHAAHTSVHNLRILWYANGIRAFQGLPPLAQLKRPSYVLAAQHQIHCPFWLSCFNGESITQFDITALETYLHSFGIVLVLPPWVSAWTRKHTELWHAELRARP
jgi:hypothetical protein